MNDVDLAEELRQIKKTLRELKTRQFTATGALPALNYSYLTVDAEASLPGSRQVNVPADNLLKATDNLAGNTLDLEIDAGKLEWHPTDGILEVKGDLQVGDADAFYFGPAGTDGSWRIVRSGNDLQIERRESGSWVSKSTIAA